jgi:processive 1,2-diacylglycerol beta-glucosyltransferase
MVIVNPIPGQEERNADYLLEEGAAIRGNNLPALAWRLDRLLGDPARLAALRAAARRIARLHAARDVVAALRPTARGQMGAGPAEAAHH